MSELTLESLNLKKSLEKMTAKELRDVVINKIPQITGASGMDKDALVTSIKDVLGIGGEEGSKVNPYKAQIGTLKKSIREMRAKKVASESGKEREILRKKINKLKKRTRRLAKAV